MKILHIVRNSYPVGGGNCLRTLNITEAQAKLCIPYVFTSNYSKLKDQYSLGKTTKINGVNYIHIPSEMYRSNNKHIIFISSLNTWFNMKIFYNYLEEMSIKMIISL